VIAVTSGKGGVGKSTIALNMSLALTRHGRSVILWDADDNLANLEVMAGVSPRYRMGDVRRGERDIEDVLVELVPGLRLLPGSSGDPAYSSAVDQGRNWMEEVVAVEPPADFIVIDTGAGISTGVLSYACGSDSAIIVTNSEPTSLMDAYAMAKSIIQRSPDHRIEVVMNSIARVTEADAAAQKLQLAVRHFLNRGIGFLGSVPYDAQVPKAVAAQEPVIRRTPTSSAALSIASIAKQIVEQSVINGVRIQL
jgi:flagellar biosynthesis protein FlhG